MIDRKDIYKRDYFPSYYTPENKSLIRQLEWRARLVTNNVSRRGRLLDIGCALGWFLEIVQRSGFDVYGVDISERAIKQAVTSLGTDKFLCLDAEKEELPYENGFFDVITMFDFLEHLENPYQFWGKVNRILKDDGTIFIETLNYNSVFRRLFGKRWFGFHEGHLTPDITPAKLKNSLQEADFRVLRCFTKLHPQFFWPYKLNECSKFIRYPWEAYGMVIKTMFKLPYHNIWFQKRLYFGDILCCIARKSNDVIPIKQRG